MWIYDEQSGIGAGFLRTVVFLLQLSFYPCSILPFVTETHKIGSFVVAVQSTQPKRMNIIIIIRRRRRRRRRKNKANYPCKRPRMSIGM
jgi:hypothetical protein